MFRFVANLKPYTIDPLEKPAHFASYLLSVDYAKGLGAALRQVHAERRVLAADNGNFDRIGKLIEKLAPRAKPLAEARRREEKALDRYARPGDLSKELVAQYAALAKEVAEAAKLTREGDRVREVVAAQTAMSPSYLIGMEDFTVPLLIALGVERPYAKLPASYFAGPADRAIAYAEKTQSGAFGPCTADVFAGLHALDLDTARAAGRKAGAAKLLAIGTGLGAALSDPSYTDYRLVDGRVVELGAAVPRPYVRVLEVASGLHLGFAEASGRLPRFHALGAGTPILLPLLAALGDKGTYTATDSTAPIKDAYSSKTIAVYVDAPALLKLKAYVTVERWLDGGLPWNCACPSCGPFLKDHPFAVSKARAWWASEKKRSLTPQDLWAPSPLAEHMPLLAMPKDPALRKRAGLARVAHNHWILRRTEAAIRRHSGTRAELREWVDGAVEKYVKAGSAPAWKTATKAAWAIARGASVDLEKADPGGEVEPTRPMP